MPHKHRQRLPCFHRLAEDAIWNVLKSVSAI